MPLHPLVVHFPPVLLLVAGVVYVLGWLMKRPGLDIVAFCLHAAGLIACIAAIFTGDFEADRFNANPQLHELIEGHESLVTMATYAFGMLGLWAFLRQKSSILLERLGFLVAFWAVTIVLLVGAHRGGALVYEHGVGVSSNIGPHVPVNPSNQSKSLENQ